MNFCKYSAVSVLSNWLYSSELRWPITATAITERNTVNKENLTNKKVLLTYKEGLISYKEDLFKYTKQFVIFNP